MATFTQRGDKWQAQVALDGVRKAKTFQLKSEAKRWAAKIEEDIRSGSFVAGSQTLHEAFRKYRDEVSPTKRGAKWEELRLNKFLREIDDAPLDPRLTTKLAEWRDKRLKEVAPGSVRREMNLIASVIEQARREWRWCSENYLRDVKKPPSPPARRRGVSEEECRKICERLGYSDDLEVTMKTQEVAIAFQLGIETGMRSGEILTAKYDLERRVAYLEKTKNGDARQVPLSSRALFLISKINGRFTVDDKSRDVLFRSARDAVGLKDLTFHDSRSEGVTRLSKRLDVTQLARVIGHRDLRSLLFYYSESAEDMAKRLG